MHDRRIQRGSTYAAMVIPAGTNPDAMVMDKSYPKKRTFRKPGDVSYFFQLKLIFFTNRPPKNQEMYIQIATFQLQSQYLDVFTWKFKLIHIKKY